METHTSTCMIGSVSFYEPSCPSVGWLVGQSVSNDFLKTLPSEQIFLFAVNNARKSQEKVMPFVNQLGLCDLATEHRGFNN